MPRTRRTPAGRPVIAYVPDNLDLGFLPQARQDAARYVVGRLYLARHVAGEGFGPDDYQRLYAPLLQALVGYDYRRAVISPLLAHGIIDEDDSYRPMRAGRSGYSKGFRLAEPYRGAQFRTVPLTHAGLLRRLDRHQREQDLALAVPVYVHLRTWLDRLTVTSDYPKDVLPLRVLADGERRMSVCRQGRVHTNLTNLKRDYRRFLALEQEDGPLHAIDVKTCQPLLLALAIRNLREMEGNQGFRTYVREREGEREEEETQLLPYVGDLSPSCVGDIERFLDLCLTGDVYQPFVQATGYTRQQVKKYFLATIYGRPGLSGGTKVGRAFQAAFPGLWQTLEAAKANGHARLPCFMQAVESWLVIWRACGRLARERPDAPLLTLHDCLVTTEANVEQFRRVLEDEFRAVWGVVPQTDVKPLAA